MLNSYYSSSPNQLLTREKEQDPMMSKIESSPVAVAPVTSESEADGSTYSSSLSCDDSTTFYPKPRFQCVESNNFTSSVGSRSRKRGRVDFSTPLDQSYLDARVESTKTELLSRLENEGISPAFRKELASLEKYAKLKASASKKRKSSCSPIYSMDSANVDGTWLTISPPEYPSCLGKNAEGDSLFTLGRMTFDMFQPSDLVCSIQKQYNTIKTVELNDLPHYVPKSLRKEVENERSEGCSGRLKTYNIIASFTIEHPDGSSSNGDAHQDTSKKLRGILTSYGYALPDPAHPDRKSIWFTGGTIEPADDDSLDEWKKIFGTTLVKSLPNEAPADEGDSKQKESLIEADKARTLASKILLGAVHEPMDNEGIVGFHLCKPIGGHGSAYCDVVYMDDELRVMRGHSGSIYVFKRV